MTLTEFLFLLDLHGPDLARWPDGAAASALRLVDVSVDAARAFAEAHRLDALLRADGEAVDDGDIERVLEQVRVSARRAGNQLRVALRSWGLVPLWPRVGLLAAALVLGLIVGAHVGGLRPAQTASLGQLVWPSYGSERFLDDVRR